MFEEIEGKKKHSVAFTILGIFVILATIGGVAVAAYTWNFASNKANSISTGSISMSLLESVDAIDITDALPMQDSDGKAQGKKFDFSVTTSASGAPGNITYTLSITKLAVDSGYTALPDSSVKVYLATFDGNTETQVMAPKLVSKIITSGDTGVLTFDSGKTSYLTHAHTTANTTKTTKYRLRMWVDKDVDASSWTKDTKQQYKLKISTKGSI